MSCALVTGGAIGLGRAFSELLADRGYDLFLTSRNLEHLASAQKEIQAKYRVKVHIFVGDLSKVEFRDKLISFVEPYDIDLLINNAGFGHNDLFEDAPLDKEYQMIDLNIKALHHLMKHFYGMFKTKGQGRIINVSSLAGFVPGAYASTYYASKAYVTSITRALAYEAKVTKSNVKIQALCPGPLKTQFFETAGTQVKFYKRDPKFAARAILDSKRVVVVPSLKEKLAHGMLKVLPTNLTVRFAGFGQRRKKKSV
ncbi:SDR family NAD(P)-dependent oxidoreductase [Acholeplasma vituli]|uniref:SDR family NAD(P)-dependent oxidoreductase n=1 Tax=Paracholeplasma vituli TaxID=69473 RepID=A0ABT2PYM1_9MOLU|nr:SDR family NAD(P)-dependent oxidoreductase [Paracholeplasma vituli]MCU0104827.1 SDR family NAD(P)-dependent oxidoreductase [Paracholeplasma vituli]